MEITDIPGLAGPPAGFPGSHTGSGSKTNVLAAYYAAPRLSMASSGGTLTPTSFINLRPTELAAGPQKVVVQSAEVVDVACHDGGKSDTKLVHVSFSMPADMTTLTLQFTFDEHRHRPSTDTQSCGFSGGDRTPLPQHVTASTMPVALGTPGDLLTVRVAAGGRPVERAREPNDLIFVI